LNEAGWQNLNRWLSVVEASQQFASAALSTSPLSQRFKPISFNHHPDF